MSDTLEQVLADARGEAAVLRKIGNGGTAEYVESLCDKVSASSEDFLRKLLMADARLKSGLSERTLRRRFRELHECGLAGYTDRHEMWFRSCVIPQRAGIEEQRQRGRDVA